MDAEICQRLIDAERDLLSALSDEDLLLPFHSTWSKLEVDISDMKLQGVLTEDTLALAHTVASRISIISRCYLDVRQEKKFLMATFAGSRQGTVAGQSSVSSASAFQLTDERCSSFTATTSKWLLEHIHNPYPSPQFKTSVAETCGCSPNSVNSWFIGARRRIGWTSVCREQFRNCRADAVDAAYRALVRQDPARPLPRAIMEAFLAVKANAEGLFSMFTRHTTAIDLDTVVNEVASCGAQGLTTEGNGQRGIRRGTAKNYAYHEDQCSEATTYPTFSSSPPPVSSIPTLVPSLSDESDDEDQDVAPPVLAGRKRRTSLSENQCTSAERPKRLCVRPSSSPKIDATELSFPSSDDRVGTHASLETQASCVLPRSRKRRLSEGAQRGVPKYPHGLPVTPRSQVVSDPLPTTISVESGAEDWFQTNFQTLFDLPAPVECSDLDSSMPWEVLFGGYSIPPASHQSEPHLMHTLSGSSETVPQDLRVFDADFSGFDDLFLPFGNEACKNTSPGIESSPLYFSPVHQFSSDRPPSLGSVSCLDDWVTFCESTPETQGLGTHVSFEPGCFDFPDLSVSQPLVDSKAVLVLSDTGLPTGA